MSRLHEFCKWLTGTKHRAEHCKKGPADPSSNATGSAFKGLAEPGSPRIPTSCSSCVNRSFRSKTGARYYVARNQIDADILDQDPRPPFLQQASPAPQPRLGLRNRGLAHPTRTIQILALGSVPDLRTKIVQPVICPFPACQRDVPLANQNVRVSPRNEHGIYCFIVQNHY